MPGKKKDFSPSIYPTQQNLPCKQICLRINWKETNFSVRFSLTVGYLLSYSKVIQTNGDVLARVCQ